MQDRHAHATAHQSKHDGNGRGGRQTQTVKEIQKGNFGDHHCKEDDHQVFKGIHFRVPNTRTRNRHHAAREGGTDQNAKAGNDHHGFERGDARAESTAQEVDSVITHTDEEVGTSQKKQENKTNTFLKTI